MKPADLALLHARCFADAPPPWSASAIASAMAAPGTIALGGPQGFVLGRVMADEAELLTLAVVPEARRRGLGRRLLNDFAAAARAQGARLAFLEVAEGNDAARALYAAAGWIEVGRRPGYYAGSSDALILRLTFDAAQDSG